jgi:CrcB protein
MTGDHGGHEHSPLPIDPDLAPTDPAEPSLQHHAAVRTPGWRSGRADVGVLAAIAAGGAMGALARYGTAAAIHVPKDGFPWATLWTNLSGSLVLGFALSVILERYPTNRYLRPFFATGFVGAFTTFSTFAVETDLLVKDGHAGTAALYVIVSILCGLLLVASGMSLARRVTLARSV